MTLKVAHELRSFLPLHIVDLSKLSIPEESVLLATVNAFDVHSQSHDDLEISVGTGFILDSDLHGFVGDLHHLEVPFHLLLQDGVVQDRHSSLVGSTENLLVTSPLQLGNGDATLGLDGRPGVPAFAGGWAFSAQLFALPHHDVSIFGSSTENSPS